MACFLVPATEAIVSTIVTKKIDSKESAADTLKVNASEENLSVHIPLSRKMRWLNNMLWGGSALLALSMYGMENLRHGSRSLLLHRIRLILRRCCMKCPQLVLQCQFL